jgi:hypothetical protein
LILYNHALFLEVKYEWNSFQKKRWNLRIDQIMPIVPATLRLVTTYVAIPHELKNDRILPKNVGLRQIKYLNNIVEQDHRPLKRIVLPMLGFQSFHTAIKTLKGIEIMHMIKKGQVETLNRCVSVHVQRPSAVNLI